MRLVRNEPAELALKPELVARGLGLFVVAGVVDQRVVRNHLPLLVGAAAADVLAVAAGDLGQLARVADALGEAEAGAAATGPFAEPASQPSRAIPEEKPIHNLAT